MSSGVCCPFGGSKYAVCCGSANNYDDCNTACGGDNTDACGWVAGAGAQCPFTEDFYQARGVCCTPGGGISNVMYTAKNAGDCNTSGGNWFSNRNTCNMPNAHPNAEAFSNSTYTSCIL